MCSFSHGSYEYHGEVIANTRESVAQFPLNGRPVAIALFAVYMLLYLLLLGLDLALVRRSLQAIGEIRSATAPGPVLAQRMRCASPGVPATSDSSSS